MTVRDIANILEEIAPLGLQENYDNCGLNLGSFDQEVTGILCTLDVTHEVLDEALQKKANLIICHHPLLFSPLISITSENTTGSLIMKAIRHQISVYAQHTNLDNVPNGVNARISEKIGLTKTRILLPQPDDLYKLVCYVPLTHFETVQTALFEAGAGQIGNYDSCSFSLNGQGTFRALDQAKPFVGKKGILHTEPEMRLEVILPRILKPKIIKAMLSSHPYEEVAYDLIPLANENPAVGAGMIGYLEKEISLGEFIRLLKHSFNTGCIRYTGHTNKNINKVAVCGGSGAFLIGQAVKQQVDAYVTADLKYHQFFEGSERMSLIDIGHYESEQYTKEIFYESVIKKLPKFAVHLSEVKTNPINYYN
ncbi:MAG: Nif3-like dinuclear metal center hexameric protein [Bacteroidota bacterium]|nr:MAG: Nif3-like dinuclear metal center hexameric protein [Bacteroidota bacterium]